jgi:hypothetical protein
MKIAEGWTPSRRVDAPRGDLHTGVRLWHASRMKIAEGVDAPWPLLPALLPEVTLGGCSSDDPRSKAGTSAAAKRVELGLAPASPRKSALRAP